MPNHYFQYWGKADEKYVSAISWHPLAYHCLDVAACGHVLLNAQPAWLASLGRLSGISLDKLPDWVAFLLILHDSGKFGDGFQSLRPDLWQILQGRTEGVRLGERHDTLGYELLMESLPQWLNRPELARRGGQQMRPWLAAVTGHHGKPPKNLFAGDSVRLLRDHFPAQVLDDTRQFALEAVELLLPDGCPLPAIQDGQAERYGQASWLLSGLAVTADWLGSNTRWFPYRQPTSGLAEYWRDTALPQAHRAVAESGLAPTTPIFPGFGKLFPQIKTPTPLQAWAEAVHITNSPQLFVLEELTGAGKTEVALTLAARLMAQGQGRGLYLALPTMATADAMFDRVRRDDGWRRFFASGEAQLALAHSADRLKLRLEEANRQDAGYGPGEEESASRNCTAWLADSRKKALLADFGVGTLDQALLAVLPRRHQSLRLLGLADKVLIVDEVHACDCYMGELLSRLLRFHAALGGSAILLSATLPLAQRARYIKAFAEGAEIAMARPVETGYPLASHFSTNGLAEQPIETRAESARHVDVQVLHEEREVQERLQNSLAQGRCVVWIRNTVADALETWKAWNASYPEYPATLFHARFALVDRLRIGKEVETAFGSGSTAGTRCGRLVIATQVIEQSLDVDFDDMVTDLAPIDLIVQRAGRLQRHLRAADGTRLHEPGASDGRGGTQLVVLMPVPVEDAGKRWMTDLLPRGGMVYPDHGKLWLTARWLSKNGGFDLPRQARDMIEAVYDDAAFDSLPEGLKEIALKAEGACRADQGVARGNLLAFDEGYSPTSLQWQDEGEAPTRLGEKTVRLRLARLVDGVLQPWAQTMTGMEWALSELTVPSRLIAKESERMAAALATARFTMPDEGRYVVIVALEEDGETWRGYAKSMRDEEVCVAYSSVMGLTVEKGVKDESDQ
ncbi:MAG: CRISPR-associated helicase Cas3' [Nitrospira defluvii]|nr:CRISPR-associated helicase Cas3' [Nitrospira defluvii]